MWTMGLVVMRCLYSTHWLESISETQCLKVVVDSLQTASDGCSLAALEGRTPGSLSSDAESWRLLSVS